jgi:hypothetical protein
MREKDTEALGVAENCIKVMDGEQQRPRGDCFFASLDEK